MIITVIGLGLIGGSFCKAIKQKTNHTCLGVDLSPDVIKKAVGEGAIDGECKDLSVSDITIVCLYPEATVDFILNNKNSFKKGSIVADACGIKEYIVSAVKAPLNDCGVTFIGAHPMAGREFSGYDYSLPDLYEKASFIMTPEGAPEEDTEKLRKLALDIGFRKVVITTPREHDEIIAYTSQLAHIVSSAYIKSPTLQKEVGFSAGSFKDLTRVAKLNEDMWTSLFLKNREPLIFEIKEISERLDEYLSALENEDENRLKELLRDGRILKENSLNRK
ncbi:MAG: prephenate dehydrogenase [Oscillospiraceae bacterium]